MTSKSALNNLPPEFYFLRHGETDFNLHQIYNDFHDVPLNETGRKQAKQVATSINKLSLSTVYISPLKRALQTYDIINEHVSLPPYRIVDAIRECKGDIWKAILKEKQEHTADCIIEFTNRISESLFPILETNSCPLILAHGGVFWAICHILKIDPSKRFAKNCQLLRIYSSNDNFEVQSLS